MHLSSLGGSVYSGFGLIGTMKSSKTPIHVIASGRVMSMGFMITVAADKRYARPYTSFMYHTVSSLARGTLTDLIEDVEETQRLQDMINTLVIEKTNIKKKDLKRIQKRKRDWFFGTEDALAYKVIDEVV